MLHVAWMARCFASGTDVMDRFVDSTMRHSPDHAGGRLLVNACTPSRKSLLS